MENIILSKKEIKKRQKNPVDETFRGANGACSFYEEGLIKVFYDEITGDLLDNVEANINRESKIIMYPKCKVLEKSTGKTFGYYMDIAPGKTLLRIRNQVLTNEFDISFEEFLSLYYDAFLPELKKEKVLIRDMKECQIYVDDNIYLTDTDPFISEDSLDAKKQIKLSKYSDVFSENLKEINKIFYYTFNFLGNVFIWMDEDYMGTQNFMYNFINEINKKTNGDVKTLGEFSRYPK